MIFITRTWHCSSSIFNRIQGYVLLVGVEYQVDGECCVQTGHTSANIGLFFHAHQDNVVGPTLERISADE